MSVRDKLTCFALCLVILLPIASIAHADDPAIGMVTEVQNEAQIVSHGATTDAKTGSLLYMKNELRTGSDSRLKVTFRDNTILTLGEKASLVIDKYVFDPDKNTGEIALDATKGALRFVTGRMKHLHEDNITVTTPVAALAVRGTDFWFGPIYSHYGAYNAKGSIFVSTKVSGVTLLPGRGTDILSGDQAPGPPTKWPPGKIALALGQTNFNPALEHGGLHHHGPGQRGENEPGTQNALSSPGSLVGALGAEGLFVGITNSVLTQSPPQPGLPTSTLISGGGGPATPGG